MNVDIIASIEKNPEFESFVHQGIVEFNNLNSLSFLEVRKPGSISPLYIIAKDRQGKTIGGLVANTYWGWLDIEDFFLPEMYREKGLGSKILTMAEDLAVKRGCGSCHLTTYDFNAYEFYLNRGYYVVGTLDNYPPGSVYYWMRKDF